MLLFYLDLNMFADIFQGFLDIIKICILIIHTILKVKLKYVLHHNSYNFEKLCVNKGFLSIQFCKI